MLDIPHHVLGGVWDAGCGGEVVELGDAEAGVVVQLHHEALHLLVLGTETLYFTLEMETKNHPSFYIHGEDLGPSRGLHHDCETLRLYFTLRG